jgi:hypothetical protein
MRWLAGPMSGTGRRACPRQARQREPRPRLRQLDLAHDGDEGPAGGRVARPGSPAIAARSGGRRRAHAGGIAASDGHRHLRHGGLAQVSAEVGSPGRALPYFLLWGRREVMHPPRRREAGRHGAQLTWNILHDQVLATLRNSQPGSARPLQEA